MYPRKHSADFLFLLIIFGFFCGSGIFHRGTGRRIFTAPQSAIPKNWHLVDMAAGYIAEKLRQTDETGQLLS